MSDAHRAAVTAELNRLVLGGRPARPELVPSRLEILDYFHKGSRG